MRSRIQFVFQDPFSSLDPKMLVKDIVAEPVQAQLKNYKLVKRKDAKGKTVYQMIDKDYKLVVKKDGSGKIVHRWSEEGVQGQARPSTAATQASYRTRWGSKERPGRSSTRSSGRATA